MFFRNGARYRRTPKHLMQKCLALTIPSYSVVINMLLLFQVHCRCDIIVILNTLGVYVIYRITRLLKGKPFYYDRCDRHSWKHYYCRKCLDADNAKLPIFRLGHSSFAANFENLILGCSITTLEPKSSTPLSQ